MARIFTITEGLENLGALKTGGQGSVYKGKRIGEIFTAIKIIPTPVSSETEADKNFVSFRNEVQKLRKVNEEPNPNVVKILNSGITDSGNFPFIEMEYIEGPDLGELLKPPYEPVFTIKETLKVAEHLSNALAHCHRANVRHGDIKSNNVKFNIQSGNYILLDFGLSVMSDEQRRTSLRHAGAIEFMAPEQTEGHMYFETDVYSFGIIIYELLAGTVPFPLKDNGEAARNAVVVAHMETSPPDILELRKENLPESWSEEKKKAEMLVPAWLIRMTSKCLEKKPKDRFAHGTELQEFIHANQLAVHNLNPTAASVDTKQTIELQKEIELYKSELTKKERELQQARAMLINPSKVQYPAQNGISKTLFFSLLIVTLGLASYAAYSIFKKNRTEAQQTLTTTQSSSDSLLNGLMPEIKNDDQDNRQDTEKVYTDLNKDQPLTKPDDPVTTTDTSDKDDNVSLPPVKDNPVKDTPATDKSAIGKKYKIAGIAYLYDKPEATARTGALITSASKVTLVALDDKDGYIYVEFNAQNGETNRTWLNKKDLFVVED